MRFSFTVFGVENRCRAMCSISSPPGVLGVISTGVSPPRYGVVDRPPLLFPTEGLAGVAESMSNWTAAVGFVAVADGDLPLPATSVAEAALEVAIGVLFVALGSTLCVTGTKRFGVESGGRGDPAPVVVGDFELGEELDDSGGLEAASGLESCCASVGCAGVETYP